MAVVSLNKILLREFWCRVCAVGRGDFASTDRGRSHEHSAFHSDYTTSCPHDCRYDSAQSRPCIAEQSLACLQALRCLAQTIAGRCEERLATSDQERREHFHPEPNNDRSEPLPCGMGSSNRLVFCKPFFHILTITGPFRVPAWFTKADFAL